MYKLKLKPGQMAPEGNTGRVLSDGYIVIDGPATDEVLLGNKLATDPEFDATYDIKPMLTKDTTEYNELLTFKVENTLEYIELKSKYDTLKSEYNKLTLV